MSFWILDAPKNSKPLLIPGSSKWVASEMYEFSSLVCSEVCRFEESVNHNMAWLNDQINEIVYLEEDPNVNNKLTLLLKSPKKSPIKIDTKDQELDLEPVILDFGKKPLLKGQNKPANPSKAPAAKKKSSILINPMYLEHEYEEAAEVVEKQTIQEEMKQVQKVIDMSKVEEMEEIQTVETKSTVETTIVKDTIRGKQRLQYTALPSRTPLSKRTIKRKINKIQEKSPLKAHMDLDKSPENAGLGHIFSNALSRAKSIFKHSPTKTHDSNSLVSRLMAPTEASAAKSVKKVLEQQPLHDEDSPTKHRSKAVSPVSKTKQIDSLRPNSPLRNLAEKRKMSEETEQALKKRKTNEFKKINIDNFKTPLTDKLSKESSLSSIKKTSDITKLSLDNKQKPDKAAANPGESTPKFNGSQLMKTTLIKNASTMLDTSERINPPVMLTPKNIQQLKKPKTVLPEIYSDSEDDDDPSILKSWANSPELKSLLKGQQQVDPDSLFGPIGNLNLLEIFQNYKHKKQVARSSSARWENEDVLTSLEVESYKYQMGYTK